MANKETNPKNAALGKTADADWQQIFDAVTDSVMLLDMDYRILKVNKATLQLFNLPVDKVLGSKCYELMYGTAEPPPECSFEKIKKEKTHQEIEMYLTNKKIWANISFDPVLNSHGNLTSVIHIVKDITSRKRAGEEADNLAKFVSEDPNPVMRITADGRVVYANRASKLLLESWGHKPGDVIPAGWHKFINEIIRSRAQANSEVKINDQTFLLIYSPVAGTDYINIYGLNITERKRVEEALKQSEAKYRNIIESAPVGMHMYKLESDGRLVFIGANPAADKILGIDNRQFIGKTIEEAFPPLAMTEVPRMYRLAARDGQFWHNDQINYHEGKISGAFMVDAFQTSPGMMVAAFQDITKQKQAEEILKKKRDILEETVAERDLELGKIQKELLDAKRLSDIGELAATIAHELRNPLGVIKSAIFNMKKEREELAQDAHIARIDRKIFESDKIISNLLSYSRLQLPKLEKVICNYILKICLDEVKSRFIKPSVQIKETSNCRLDDYIMADPVQIFQLYANLIENAFHALPDQKGIIEINGNYNFEENKYVIEFKDNGIGISEEDLQRVFDPFFSKKPYGIGLGLSVCKEIVNLHNGTIEIKSKVGEGTLVTVTLPIND